MNKSAKKMFEELGYECISGEDSDMVNYQKLSKETAINGEYIFYELVFYKDTRKYWASGWYNEYQKDTNNIIKKPRKILMIDLPHIKAIQKQIEELGWNEK